MEQEHLTQPTITGTTHTLPFDKLSPRDFERLCLWLVEREGYERAEHLGAAGSEQGRDIVAWREGVLWAFQCKRVQRFGPKDALAEVEKVLALPEDQRPAGLVFLVTCDVSANTRQQVRARCAGEMECHFWAGTELDEKVKRHPGIAKEFFQVVPGSTSTIVGDKIVLDDIEDTTVAAGRRSAAAGRGGVAISGDVGGDITISFGDRQVAIPRIAQIAIAVVTLGVIFLVAAQAINLHQFSVLTKMEGDFNIAVAQFQVVGEGEGLDDAQELAQSFTNAIDREMQTLAGEIDQRIEVRPPQKTGIVKGDTEEERAESAHALAAKINADVVIYGIIEVNGIAATIKPEFFVRSEEFCMRSEELTTVAEVTGQYRMGSAVFIDKVDNMTRKREAGSILAERFRALTFITYGLADYVVGKYEAAEMDFKRALEIQAWDNPDVIYIMLGNAALRQHDWAKSEGYCQQALEVNPVYSRAYVTLGSVFFEQSLRDIQSETYDTVDTELLNQSIETYQQALDPSMDHPPLADITTKASYGLGHAYLLKALVETERGESTASEQDLALALQAFQFVVQDYGGGNNLRIEELTAHAHARLGLIYRLTNQFETAISEYKQALKLLPHLERTKEQKAAYEAALGDIYIRLNQPSEAIEWYERAVEDAPPGSDDENKYQEKLNELR